MFMSDRRWSSCCNCRMAKIIIIWDTRYHFGAGTINTKKQKKKKIRMMRLLESHKWKLLLILQYYTRIPVWYNAKRGYTSTPSSCKVEYSIPAVGIDYILSPCTRKISIFPQHRSTRIYLVVGRFAPNKTRITTMLVAKRRLSETFVRVFFASLSSINRIISYRFPWGVHSSGAIFKDVDGAVSEFATLAEFRFD